MDNKIDPPDPPHPDLKRKAQRSDVSNRKKKAKYFKTSCITRKWNNFCKDENVKTGIAHIADLISRFTLEVYQVLNFHYLRCIPENKPFPDLDVTIIRNICQGLLQKDNWNDESESFDQFLIESCQIYLNAHPEWDSIWNFKERMRGLSFLVTELSAHILTMAENHLVFNFAKRMIRWLKLRHGFTENREAWKFVYEAFESRAKGFEYISSRHQEFVNRFLYFPSEENIRANFNHYLFISWEILFDIEKLPEATPGARIFSLLPLKSGFNTDHLQLSNSSLQQCLTYIQKRMNYENVTYLGNPQLLTKSLFDANADALWNSLFDINETGNRKFAKHISTNGCSVSVHMEVPKNETNNMNSLGSGKHDRSLEYDIKGEKKDFEQIVGIDPGHINLYYASVASASSNEIRKIHCSNSQYRHEAGMKNQTFWHTNIRKRFPAYELTLNSLPTLCVSDVDVFLERAIIRAQNKEYLFNFHLKNKGFLNHKFRVKSLSEKTLRFHCKKLTTNKKGEKVKTLIGIGDWSRSDGFLKKHPSAPNLKFQRMLESYASELVSVDEYKTSQLCHKCKSKNEHPKIPFMDTKLEPPTISSRSCHHVLRCINNECRMWWNRDVTGSLNIREILTAKLNKQPRPLCFSRQTRLNRN